MNRRSVAGLLIAAVVVVAVVAYVLIGQSSKTNAATIGEILAENGYTEFKPPSRHVPPGTLVLVVGENPVSLSVICRPLQSLGLEVEQIPVSPSISTKMSAALERSLGLDGQFLNRIKSNAQLNDIEDIVIQLDNIRLLEVADDDVISGLPNRSDACKEAVRLRFEANQAVTMIKSALVADVLYTAKAKTGGTGGFSVDAQDALAATLDAKVSATDGNKIELRGENLIWGVRDDRVLARLGSGLPATGNESSNRQMLSAETPVESVTLDEQARRQFPEGLRRASYNLKPLRQSGSMDCWATVYTMLASWKDGRNYSVREAIAELGEPYQSFWRKNTGLPGGQERIFVRDAGMVAKPPAAYFLSGYIDMLNDHGPLWIITGDGISSHAKLLVGIYGPEPKEDRATYEKTTFEFIDPWTGTFQYQPALDFMGEFEREAQFIVNTDQDDVDLRWQILHL